MPWIVQNLWLIPALPLLAAGLSGVTRQPRRRFAAGLAIGSMGLSFLLSLCAFSHTLVFGGAGAGERQVVNFVWLTFGDGLLELGWVLDPLGAILLVMVSLVSLLIFIYSVGYMARDENFTRFFCFLALFGAAMLGLVMANSLLLLFMCWEIVGLTSYLLIGFWYHKPSAAAAAKKAFITTRVGDVALFVGMLWLYSQSGTLLFYNHGRGCLEASTLTRLVTQATGLGLAVSTGIGLLIFAGAVGKSGQVPLHVWLPDAMEGPTPVSALIHAATMVAAGVFLVARVYPLMAAHPPGATAQTAALVTIAWVGAITAVFAALIAAAQDDIKRILAYSTVSQLGYMMLGLGVGGVAVGVFHLITHAFFKALLFLGSGSVIHGCHDEQDIRRMGGLRKFMPVTFATYAAGMLALCGFPLFAGFWSKDEILDAAHGWSMSRGPFYLGVIGAFLTAFYMTRQVCYVFFGRYRGTAGAPGGPNGHASPAEAGRAPHESPPVMTLPLVVLAVFAGLLGFVGTPAWPWFQQYLSGGRAVFSLGRLFESGVFWLMVSSSVVVLGGLGLGWSWYGRAPAETAEEADALQRKQPALFALLRNKFYVDEFYEATLIRFNAAVAAASDWLDRWIWNGVVQAVSYLVLGLSWLNRLIDEYVINLGFDEGCSRVRGGGRLLAGLQTGRVQDYLRVIGIALVVFLLLLTWGCGAS